MYCVRFQIAQLVLEVQLPFPVAIDQRFRPFVTLEAIPDSVARFEKVKTIQSIEGRVISQSGPFEVVAVQENTWVRRYFDTHNKNHYICLGRTLADGCVLIEFLPESKECLKSIECAFFYIAFEEQLIHHDRWIIHASCVNTPLGAILFVGPSGVGKTTQAELWEKYRGSKVLNGDRTIVYQKDGVWYAAGSPYAGSSKRYVNESAPICVVALLEQGTDNRVQALTPGQAFRSLYPHLTVNDWNPWYVETITNQLDQFVRERPVVHFSCTPDERAVDALWSELTKEVDHG